MKIIVKSKKVKNADGFLFGLKGLSIDSNLVTLEELEKMDTSNIYIAIDKNIFNDDLNVLEESLLKLEELNIKGIFFYDLAVLSLIKKLGINIPLIWNQNFFVTNYRTCNYYKKEGASGAFLSSLLTIDEIEEIVFNTDMNLFVSLFGHQLMAFSKRNLITNYFSYIGEENDRVVNYMMERGKSYPVVEEEFGTKFYTKDVLCGIRYFNRLKKVGIDYIVLNDDLLGDDVFSQVYDIFKEVVSLELSDDELLLYEKRINDIVDTSLEFFDKEMIFRVKRND